MKVEGQERAHICDVEQVPGSLHGRIGTLQCIAGGRCRGLGSDEAHISSEALGHKFIISYIEILLI